MPWNSINNYSEQTGFARETVKKRLDGLERRSGDHGAYLYDSKQAYPAIYQLDDDENLDAQNEGAKLSRERRKKTRVERLVLEGGLVPAGEVVRFCYDMNVSIRNKVLAIPNLLRNKYPHIDAGMVADVEDVLEESLTELADDGIPRPLADRMSIYLSGASSTTEADDQ